MTLPMLIVRERATPPDQNLLRQWLENWEPAFLPEVVELIEKYDAFAESRAVVQQYLNAARQALAIVPASEGRAGLMGLTEFLAEQTEALGVAY
jgi:geranylgeranyl pyrophosphate synthase